MRRAQIAAALAATCLWPAADAAAESHARKLHLLTVMERLAARPADANAPVFTRSATLSVSGNITIVSPELAGPLRCAMVFGAFDGNTRQFHFETISVPVKITGRSGTCTITAPFRWQNLSDDAEFGMGFEVANVPGRFLRNTVAGQPARISQFPGLTFPLPIEGESLFVTFDIRI